MGAPIVVNTVKVQGTVATTGTTAIIGTVSQNATWNVVASQTGGWTVSVSEAYDYNSGVNAPFKILPIGGSSDTGVWVPLGIESSTNRLLTQTTVSGSVETYTNGIATVSSNEVVANTSSSSGFSGSVFPIGIVDRMPAQWTYLEKDNGGLLVSGTVNSTVSGTVNIPSSSPAFVSGTITAASTSPAFVTGTVISSNNSSNALYTQGTVTSNVGTGTRPVSNVAASALYIQGTTTATIPASAPAYVSGTITSNAGSGTHSVANTATSAIYVQGTTTVSIPSPSPAYVTGTVQVSNGTIAVSSVGGSVETYTNGISTVSLQQGTTSSSLYTSGTDKFLPVGGTNESGYWQPFGINSTNGRLTTEIGGSVETFTYGISTVSSEQAVTYNTSATGFAGSVIPFGVVDRTSSNWGYLETLDGGLLVNGTVSGTVLATIPGTAPAYVTGTVAIDSNQQLTVINNSATALWTRNSNTSALFVQGTVAVSTGTITVSTIGGTTNVVERGSTIGQGSVTIGTAMGTVLTTSSTRRAILIQNLGTDFVWLGGSTAIVVNTGARLAPGQSISIDKSPISAIYAVASSGSQVLSYLTESD